MPNYFHYLLDSSGVIAYLGGNVISSRQEKPVPFPTVSSVEGEKLGAEWRCFVSASAHMIIIMVPDNELYQHKKNYTIMTMCFGITLATLPLLSNNLIT